MSDAPKFDLLRKTEIRIRKIALQDTNLTEVGHRVAEVLGLHPGEVVVVDYQNDTLTVDVLNTCVNVDHIVGRDDELLNALRDVPGVRVLEGASVDSNGMLGWIAMDRREAQQALHRSEQIASDILAKISKRVIVFSTGAEVAGNQVEDTNTPMITRVLEAEGYRVTRGATLQDDEWFIAAKLREAADCGGYGLIITTGGLGAEDKDRTAEAVKALDPDAATPYVCHFEIGTGRHVKDGVRIAVGQYHGTLIVALPGPTDEVTDSLRVLVDGLRSNASRELLAERIADNLRGLLKRKTARPR